MTEPASAAVLTDDWAGEMGRRWLSQLDRFEAMLAPVGDVLIARAGIGPGQRVMDLGCGGGATSRALARAVGPDGAVLGVDISPELVAAAEARRADAGPHLRFHCADAARAALPGSPYDRLVSRFGSMFFDDPVAAFAHLRSQLRPGARIDLAVWGPPRDNGWMMAIMNVVRAHVDVPPAIPRAPGPFAFEDVDYLRSVLAGGGFAGVDIDRWQDNIRIAGPGTSPEQAAHFALSSMSAARALVAAGPEVAESARRDLVTLYEGRLVDGSVAMPALVWLVSATAG